MSARTPVGPALFALLVIATLAAAVLVVRARDPDLMLEVTELTRGLTPDDRVARISFFVRESDPDAFVGIVGEDDEPVRTLDPSVSLSEDRTVTYRWDGRTDSGSRVSPESFYLRVELPSRDREMIWPKRIKVFEAPESAEAAAPG